MRIYGQAGLDRPNLRPRPKAGRTLSAKSLRPSHYQHKHQLNPPTMISLVLPLAAIGYSVIYMILGGGLFGGIVIFLVAKLFGK
jgi:hypothetical protein